MQAGVHSAVIAAFGSGLGVDVGLGVGAGIGSGMGAGISSAMGVVDTVQTWCTFQRLKCFKNVGARRAGLIFEAGRS